MDKSLYVDQFDEVPVNKYCKLNNLNSVFVMNSFTIHPIYNSIPKCNVIEEKFFKDFF
jgi:hypothetical protein